jgi:protein arginine N-methyltransferase 1
LQSLILAFRNNIKNCQFYPFHSRTVTNPIKADIVISETLGSFALDENIIENMEDSKKFLKSGGVLIPGNAI